MRYAAAILVFLAIVAAVLITLGVGTVTKPVVLPNGFKVEYLGSARSEETFSTEREWHKIARRILPKSLQGILPATISQGRCGSGTNAVTLYFRVTDLSGARVNDAPWRHYNTMDDSGFVYNADGGYCSFGAISNTLVFGLSLRAFPRRQATFDFNLLGPSYTNLATFRIDNPVKGPFPAWQPQPLPQTFTNGPVILTLQNFEVRGNQSRYVVPKWKLHAIEPAWSNARPRHTTVLDATGNEGQTLSSRESAWKIETLVYRERAETFNATERLLVTNINIPNTNNFVAIDQSGERSGVGLKLHLLAGPGKLVISNRLHRSMAQVSGPQSGHSTTQFDTNFVETWGNTQHFILLEATNVLSNDELQFHLIDNNNERIETRNSGYYGSQGRRIYQRVFTPATNAQTISIEVIISRPLRFDYVVDPKHATSAN